MVTCMKVLYTNKTKMLRLLLNVATSIFVTQEWELSSELIESTMYFRFKFRKETLFYISRDVVLNSLGKEWMRDW